LKAVILTGNLGTSISEEVRLEPKPMLEIGSKPIFWHAMKLYTAHGVNEFVICCGHKGYLIKECFTNSLLRDMQLLPTGLVSGLALISCGIIFGVNRWQQPLEAGIDAPAITVMLATLPVMLGRQFLLPFFGYDIAGKSGKAP
jgi:hypothetical protein